MGSMGVNRMPWHEEAEDWSSPQTKSLYLPAVPILQPDLPAVQLLPEYHLPKMILYVTSSLWAEHCLPQVSVPQ